MSELTNRAQTAADSLEALAAEVEWAGGHRQAVRALQDARDSALAASAFLEAADHLEDGSRVPYVSLTPRSANASAIGMELPPAEVSRLDRLDGIRSSGGIAVWNGVDAIAAGATRYETDNYVLEVTEPALRPCWDVIVAWLCILAALVLLVVGYDGVINGYEAAAFVLVVLGLAGLSRWVVRRC